MKRFSSLTSRAGRVPVVGVLAAVIVTSVTGCAGAFRSNAQLDQIYVLGIKPATAAGTASGPTVVDVTGRPSIRVGRPVAGPGLDSSHIVLLESNHRMSYFMASRWPAPLPQVVEALATQALGSSGSWTAVQSSESPFPADYLLQIRIRRFEADYTGAAAAPDVHVVLDCVLGRRTGREAVETFVAEGSASAAANRLSDVVTAFDEATAAALASMAKQAVDAAQAEPDQKVDNPVPSIKR